MSPKQCGQCKRSMNWCFGNLKSSLAPLIVHVIVDKDQHFHLEPKAGVEPTTF
jgi:hypothetical protein